MSHLLVLHCTVLYCTVLYCTALHCTVTYLTILYCTFHLPPAGFDYGSRNVLADEGIREGVKKFTSWPTIPQVTTAAVTLS